MDRVSSCALTICEAPREGDGSFVVEHPPDLTERERERHINREPLIAHITCKHINH